MSSKDNNSSLSKKLSMIAIVTTVLACIGLVYFATILFDEYKNNDVSMTKETTTPNIETSEPMSILPVEPEGITVLEKQAELEVGSNNTTVPIAAPSQIVSGYAMEVGTALSFSELSRKFSQIVTANGIKNFNSLEPRAVLSETINGLQAKLLIGPFKDEASAGEACEVLILSDGTVCNTQIFEGELIARE